MKYKRKLPVILLLLLPVISFFGFFLKCTVNAPINDDYHAVLDFLNNWAEVKTGTEKIRLVFSQHNEHRIVYDRIWALLSYKIQNNVNFNFLAFIGNLALVGITAVLFLEFKKRNHALVLFFPVSVLIFNISSWENMTFAMAGLSNFTVVFFILLSLSFLTNSPLSHKNVFLSFLFLFFAVMTQGAGLFLIPVLLLILFYKKDYRYLVIYTILSALLLILYFFNYHAPPGSAGMLDVLDVLDVYNFKIIIFVLAFLGNGFNYVPYSAAMALPVTITIGFCLLAWFAYITKKRYYRNNLFNYSLVFFIIIIAAVTATSRIALGIDTAGASRYRIYGLLLLVAMYVWVIETYRFGKNIQVAAVICVSALYWLTINLNHYQCLYQRERATYIGIMHYNSGDATLLNGDKNLTENYEQILERAARLDIYHFPDWGALESYFPYSNSEIISNAVTNTDLEMYFRIDGVQKINDSYVVSGWTYFKGKSTRNQEIFIGFKNKNESKTDFYRCNPSKGIGFISFFGKYKFQRGGFDARVKTAMIRPGENTIVVMIKNGDLVKSAATDQKIVK